MRTKNNFRRKNLLALCLSAMMLGTTVAGLAACNDGSSSSSDDKVTESTKKTVGLVQNADFETDKLDDDTPIVTSSTGWSRSLNSGSSGSARASQSASGIIDTAADAWKNLTQSKVENAASLSDADAEAKWDEMSVWDKLAFYKDWEDREENDDKKLSSLSFYQSFNIDFDDIPTLTENPLTHNFDASSTEKQDSKILMIHNEYSSSKSSTPQYKEAGTAQKYTSSSSVKVAAGTSAQFSVWVKTADLTTAWTDGSTQPAVDRGAYISITHSVGGKTMDPLLVKNINTEGVEENNGWVKYEFLLNGSSYADTTFTIVLGLGLGGGTDYHEYVNGYAFFDDIECNTISNAKYAQLKTAEYVDVAATDKNEFVSDENGTKYALAFHKELQAAAMLDAWVSNNNDDANVGVPTTEKHNTATYTAANGVAGATVYKGLGFNTTNDKATVFNNVAAMNNSGNTYLQKAYDQYFVSESDFFKSSIKDAPILMLLSAEGAAYTATYKGKLEVEPDKYMALSFFLKTSDMNGVTGAGVIVKDADTKHSLTALDTTNITPVDIDDNTKDIYDGWQQCFIFFSNETDGAKEFELSFTLGSTTVVDTTKANYESGFAAFANFQAVELDKEEFERATGGTYSLVVDLEGVQEEETGDDGFDSTVAIPFDALENGYAPLKNYKGIYADSSYLANGTNDSINQNKTAGLLSKEYLTLEDDAGTKSENAKYAEILSNLGATGATNEDKWNSLLGSATQQPLVIYNAVDTEDADNTSPAYGYIGSSKTISSDSYATVSLRVMVGGNATANVYLTNTDSETFDVMNAERTLSYWYDKDGNICSADPTASGFNTKKDVAFKKVNANGLYQANPAWRNYDLLSNSDKTAYFANLAAFTQTDADGNLLLGENSVSYDYNDNWQNEGNDGIAFYKGANGYYADKACKVLVKNLADITKKNANDDERPLTARFTAKKATENESLSFEIGNTNGKWVTVTFYIHAGSESMNYRLEVWSGSRDGDTTTEGSYVIFDAYKPDDVTADNFTSLIDERKSDLTAEEDYFENAFSFYDTDKFLRYNPDLDENAVGDSYEDYDATTYANGIAFLRYEAETEKEIFADYSYEYTEVAADVETDEEEKEEDEETEGETNVWLLASSISIAGVLLLAVVSLIVRKAMVKSHRRNAKANKSKKN